MSPSCRFAASSSAPISLSPSAVSFHTLSAAATTSDTLAKARLISRTAAATVSRERPVSVRSRRVSGTLRVTSTDVPVSRVVICASSRSDDRRAPASSSAALSTTAA